MSDAEKYYREYGGCSCNVAPPCSFCTLLTETEADILWNGSMLDLEIFWREEKLHEPESQWVTIFEYAN